MKAERERLFKEEQGSEALKGLNVESFFNPGSGKKGGIYAFEQRENRKKELADLRDNFEGYKRLLAKRQAKE